MDGAVHFPNASLCAPAAYSYGPQPPAQAPSGQSDYSTTLLRDLVPGAELLVPVFDALDGGHGCAHWHPNV